MKNINKLITRINICKKKNVLITIEIIIKTNEIIKIKQ